MNLSPKCVTRLTADAGPLSMCLVTLYKKRGKGTSFFPHKYYNVKFFFIFTLYCVSRLQCIKHLFCIYAGHRAMRTDKMQSEAHNLI